MSEKIKIAQIGVGRWGKKLLPKFHEQADIVAACHSGNQGTADWLRELGIPTLSFDDILSDKEIEAVIIALPIYLHHDTTKRALEAGKHVFVEKPGSQTPTEMQELCEIAERQYLQLAVGYKFVHAPAMKKLLFELISGRSIHAIQMDWLKMGTFGERLEYNLLVHELSILKMLGLSLGSVHKNNYGTVGQGDMLKVDDYLNHIGIYINRTSPGPSRKIVTIIPEESGKSWVWSGPNLFEIEHGNEKEIPIPLSNGDELSNEVANFLAAIRGDEKLITDGRFALEILKDLQKFL